MRQAKPGVYQFHVVEADALGVRYRTEINGYSFGHTRVTLEEWQRLTGCEVVASEPVGQASLFAEVTE